MRAPHIPLLNEILNPNPQGREPHAPEQENPNPQPPTPPNPKEQNLPVCFRYESVNFWRVIDSGLVSGRGTTRAEDAQGTPTQSHISPSILVYEEEKAWSLQNGATKQTATELDGGKANSLSLPPYKLASKSISPTLQTCLKTISPTLQPCLKSISPTLHTRLGAKVQFPGPTKNPGPTKLVRPNRRRQS